MKDRIKAARKAKRMTQEALANSLNLSRIFIAKLESGEKEPSARTVSDIARVTGVNEDWLRTGEGDMYAPASRAQEIAYLASSLLKMDKDSDRYKMIMAVVDLMMTMTDDEIIMVRDVIRKWM